MVTGASGTHFPTIKVSKVHCKPSLLDEMQAVGSFYNCSQDQTDWVAFFSQYQDKEDVEYDAEMTGPWNALFLLLEKR